MQFSHRWGLWLSSKTLLNEKSFLGNWQLFKQMYIEELIITQRVMKAFQQLKFDNLAGIL
jgi:hypothetical protein